MEGKGERKGVEVRRGKRHGKLVKGWRMLGGGGVGGMGKGREEKGGGQRGREMKE